MEQEFDAAVEEWLAEVEAELAGKNHCKTYLFIDKP